MDIETEQLWKSKEILNIKSLNVDYDTILKAISDIKSVKLIYADDNDQIIIAIIHDFYASLAIGSENWCISSVYYGGTPGIDFWNYYVNDSRRQYFVWNLKHMSNDYKLVGTTTIESTKEFYCAYNFPNSAFDMEAYILKNKIKREYFFDNE